MDPADSVPGLEFHPAQEIRQPRLPFPVFRHPLQAGVVLLARSFKVSAQVEKGFRQEAAGDEQQRNEQAADAPVAVEKRMDGLELRVDERGVHQRREGVVVKELLPLPKAGHQLAGRRGNVPGVLEDASGRTDPVLGAAKLSRGSRVSPDAPHQSLVQLPHETQGERQRVQAPYPVLQGGHVVGHLLQIGCIPFDLCPGPRGKQLAQGSLRALDAAGKHRFPVQERPDEQVRIRHQPPFPGEPAYRQVGAGEGGNQLRIPANRGGQWGRHEGAVPAWAVDKPTGLFSFCIHGGVIASPCFQARKQERLLLAHIANCANNIARPGE